MQIAMLVVGGFAPTEGVVDADGPGHALLTLNGREDLGGVLECDGTFTKRVTDGEEVNESV